VLYNLCTSPLDYTGAPSHPQFIRIESDAKLYVKGLCCITVPVLKIVSIIIYMQTRLLKHTFFKIILSNDASL